MHPFQVTTRVISSTARRFSASPHENSSHCVVRTSRWPYPPGGDGVAETLCGGGAYFRSVTYAWPQNQGSFGDACTQYSAAASAATNQHILWTCPGLNQIRRSYLQTISIHPTRPADCDSWLHGSKNHRAVLKYIAETGLHLYTLSFMPYGKMQK